mmetsp:Transcript_51055/g.142858  ORF Transcript_51055/g.142858 Transcript_51055/m.142858 type:complete len:223 (-) Transcript_51055:1292-1960(-)
MAQLADPKITPEVWLPGFREHEEIAIDKPEPGKGDEAKQGDRRRHGAKDDGDAKCDAPARATGAQAVVVLVLRLGHVLGLLLCEYPFECQELGQNDVPHQDHGVGRPLQRHEVHVEMRGVRHGVRQHAEDPQRIFHEGIHEAVDVLAHCGRHDHKHGLEPEVVNLQLVLCEGRCLEREEDLEDEDQEGGQERHHDLQAQGWGKGRPDRTQVDGFGNVGDTDH